MSFTNLVQEKSPSKKTQPGSGGVKFKISKILLVLTDKQPTKPQDKVMDCTVHNFSFPYLFGGKSMAAKGDIMIQDPGRKTVFQAGSSLPLGPARDGQESPGENIKRWENVQIGKW